MVNFLKVVISLGIAMCWYKLTGNQEISIAFFVMLLVIFFIKPIPYQSPTERKEYIEQIKHSQERQASLENLRRDVKKRAAEDKKKREEHNEKWKRD